LSRCVGYELVDDENGRFRAGAVRFEAPWQGGGSSSAGLRDRDADGIVLGLGGGNGCCGVEGAGVRLGGKFGGVSEGVVVWDVRYGCQDGESGFGVHDGCLARLVMKWVFVRE
jgi:hypothetical protein